jgi:hypothetical protein
MNITSRFILFIGLSYISATAQESPSIVAQAPEAIAPLNAPFPMPPLARPRFPDRTFDIRNHGAVEGGAVKNTEAIRQAIGAATRAGGGVVVVPAGRWLSGPIHLENNINLQVARDAELLFSQDPKDYLPVVRCRHEGIECYKYSPFIYALGKTNIAVTGAGTLIGQGKPWWTLPDQARAGTLLRQMGDQGTPVEQRIFDGGANGGLRPAFVQPVACTNVLIEGVTFRYGAFWTISPCLCENVIVRKVTVVTYGDYGHTPNGDGVDPDSCRNVLIEYCDLDTGDDCITIKCGKDTDGRRVHRPIENVIVRFCQTRHGHGGVVIGSETSGGVHNVFAHDCTFNGTDRGIRIKTGRGRGNVVENIWMQDITMGTITGEAIELNMLYTGRRLPAAPVTEATPQFRNMHFRHISCEYAQKAAISLLGLPEMPISGITLEDIAAKSAKGIVCADLQESRFTRIAVHPDRGPVADLLDSANLTFEGLKITAGADPVFQLRGAKTQSIRVAKSDLATAVKRVIAAEGAVEQALVAESNP